MKKKLLAVFAAVLMMCSLVGCASDKYNESNADQSSAEQRINLSDLKVEDYVELADYKNVAVSVAAVRKVAEGDVDSQALLLYQGSVTEQNGGVTDRAVATGDTVIMDYEGKRDGVAFAGGTAQNAELTIGSRRFIDGFEDGLIGVKPGETVDLNLTFPENYGNAELAGAKVVFTVTVHYIVPTEMKDDVVAAFGAEEYSSVSELKAYVRGILEENEQALYEQNVQGEVLNFLLENSTYKELPEAYVKQCSQVLTQNIQNQAYAHNLDADTFLYYAMGTTLQAYVAEMGPVTAKQMITLQAIAEKENLFATEEELSEYIAQIVQDGGWETEDMLFSVYDKEYIRESMTTQNALEFLGKNAVVTIE